MTVLFTLIFTLNLLKGFTTMINDSKVLEILQTLSVKPHSIDDATYKRANSLLKTYKDVLWGLEESLKELDRQSRELIEEDLSFAIEVLDKFDCRINKERVDDEMYNKEELKKMVILIAQALIKVKNYPQNGEKYFSILEKNFLSKCPYSEEKILENLKVCKTTYYKYKKEAIKLMGHCLWKMILPDVSLRLSMD